MAKLPSYRRIYHTDYEKDFQGLVEKLAVSINYGFEVLYDSLNGKLSISDNLMSSVKSVEVSVDANGTPINGSSFSLDTTSNILGLTVIDAKHNTNSNIYPTAAVFVSWTQNGSVITINNVRGLPINNEFTLKLRVDLS